MQGQSCPVPAAREGQEDHSFTTEKTQIKITPKLGPSDGIGVKSLDSDMAGCSPSLRPRSFKITLGICVPSLPAPPLLQVVVVISCFPSPSLSSECMHPDAKTSLNRNKVHCFGFLDVLF